jgi:hypothetical protein
VLAPSVVHYSYSYGRYEAHVPVGEWQYGAASISGSDSAPLDPALDLDRFGDEPEGFPQRPRPLNALRDVAREPLPEDPDEAPSTL